VAGDADLLQTGEGGSLHLEGVRNLVIEREDRGPLVVSAARADRVGEEGRLVWRFEDHVVFREPEEGLELTLPSLEVDQAVGEARAAGDIRFAARSAAGRAAAVVYGLRGQPGELTRPELADGSARLTAERALLLDGIRDVEFQGQVLLVRPDARLQADLLRVVRGAADRVRRVDARGSVRGSGSAAAGPTAGVAADRLEAGWGDAGELEELRISGDATLHHGDDSLTAAVVDARWQAGAQHWQVAARDSVYLRTRFGAAPGSLRAESVEATLDASYALTSGEAVGRVTFEGDRTRAEAERAVFSGTTPPGAVELFGHERRKARLAHERTRVAAGMIRTDVRGEDLLAREAVEATLLAAPPESGPDAGYRLFDADQAVHFVAAELHSTGAGAHLVFSGSARGWQGDRSLAADEVVVDQAHRTLAARGDVSTRIPRETGRDAIAEGDYLQIGADALRYEDATGLAVYTGEVRVGLREGWLEAGRVEVQLARESRAIEEVRAFEPVRVEVHRTGAREMDRPLAGTADRLVYRPSEAVVLLFGDRTPATVRRIGEGGGTTTGRVLRYRLDSGSLEVESGQAPARIRTGG
jgi:lipopolysaccharide transport protein LptA